MDEAGIQDVGDDKFEILVKNRTDWTIVGYRRAGYSGRKCAIDGPIGRNCTSGCHCLGERVFFVGNQTDPFWVEFLLLQNKQMRISIPFEICPLGLDFQYSLALEDQHVVPALF